jgi:hypothetical protein
MCRLVQRAEDECQHVALHDDQRHRPRGRGQPPEDRTRHDQHPEMPDGAAKGRPVRAQHQGMEIFAGNLMDGEPDQGIVSHNSGVWTCYPIAHGHH